LRFDRDEEPLVQSAGETTSDMSITYAAMLMSQFTTIERPDDDAPGPPSDDEQYFVPGQINLNTTPIYMDNKRAFSPVLSRALPMAYSDGSPNGPQYRQAIIKMIYDWRPNPKRDGDPSPSNEAYREGLAHISELFAPLMQGAGTVKDKELAGRDGDENTAMGGAEGGDGSLQADFVPEDTSILQEDSDEFGGKDDGVIDDREEKLLLAKRLAELGAVRSDTYVAYIVVQGYPAGDFSANRQEPVESARLMVLFDRSNVRQGAANQDMDEAVRVLRVLEYQLNVFQKGATA
jgi:hypothetical protein